MLKFNNTINLDNTLFPHQTRVLDKISDPNQHGLILWHGLGSGKTRSSIETIKRLKPGTTTVIVPAALQENYKKELKKWYPDVSKHTDVNIISQTALTNAHNNPDKKQIPISKDLIIVDEAHRARTPTTSLYKALLAKTALANKVLLLTGTPMVNQPKDIAPLVTLIAQEKELPVNSFDRKYVKRDSKTKQIKGLRRTTALKDILDKYVDFHNPINKENYPSTSITYTKVPMSKEQTAIYYAMLKNLSISAQRSIQKGLPPDKKDLQKLMAFLTGHRTISNTNNAYRGNEEQQVISPKTDVAVESLLKKLKSNPKYKAIVYSNFLESGLEGYKDKLKLNNIPYGEFTGNINEKIRDKLIKDYNKDKLKVLLLSSAGGEGLDLKGTRLVQLLELHWNQEKLDQVIGRAVRYKSHSHLPPSDRNVEIQQFISTLPKTEKQQAKSVDEYLMDMSSRKRNSINLIKELIKEPKRNWFERIYKN